MTETILSPDPAEIQLDDPYILKAFANASWLTPEYLVEVNAHEPMPERLPGIGPYADPVLRGYLVQTHYLQNAVYLAASDYLGPRMTGVQGHPFTLAQQPFYDEEIASIAATFAAPADYEFPRILDTDVTSTLESLMAPLALRRQVVKIMHGWNPVNPEVMTNKILWSQLVKKGVAQFLKEYEDSLHK